MYIIDQTWGTFVPGAQQSPFPLQNLPYGVFRRPGEAARVGVAIGDRILDLAALAEDGWLPGFPDGTFAQASLNRLAALGRPTWTRLRARLAELLREGSPLAAAAVCERALLPMDGAELLLPFDIPGYTDFYASEHHAFNCGVLFRGPENALPPNWKHMPIAYNGRASSIVGSGSAIRRPNGQLPPGQDGRPGWGPTRSLDFELEIGVFIGGDTELGTPVPAVRANDLVFGLVLLNDWSARDIQRWEYVPLGPFQGKAFATSISPWVVPLDALAPATVDLAPQSPDVLPYLREAERRGYDVELTVSLAPAGQPATVISRSNLRHLYWTFSQMIAHHTGGGCNLRTGDLLGSGTISGPTPDTLGCLLEITQNGRRPLPLGPSGVTRTFLQDGDTVTFEATARIGGLTIGFGTLSNTVVPAIT